jgi:hypothetical protein
MAMPDLTRRERFTVRAFFLLLLAVYFTSFPYIAIVNNPNENVRTYMTMALVEEGTFRIDTMVERHGWTNDMAKAPDKRDGAGTMHLFSVKAPAVSYAGIPVYWGFLRISKALGRLPPTASAPAPIREAWLANATWVLRIFCVQLPCFMFLVWLERFLRQRAIDTPLRLACVTAVGLGSNFLAYAFMFASHALFAVAAFLSFAIAANERARAVRDRRMIAAAASGFCAGWATLLEYHALPVSVLLVLFALSIFWRPSRLLALACGGLPHAALMAFFQWRAFGDPLTPGHRMSENGEFARLLNQGYFGIGVPNFGHAMALLFSRTYGLLGTNPYLALALFAWPLLMLQGRARDAALNEARSMPRFEAFAAFAINAALVVTVSAAINWRGGWTIGPRYLGACPPFFAFAGTVALAKLGNRGRIHRTVAHAIAIGLAAEGVLQTGLISVLCNSIPESVGRPLPELAWPLIKAEFVPKHVGDLFKAGASWPVYAVLLFILLCPILALACVRRTPRELAGLLGLSALVFGAASLLAFVPEAGATDTDGGVKARQFFASNWEPAGRDRISTLRKKLEQNENACDLLRLAALERSFDLAEAQAHEARAIAKGGACP